MGPDFVCDLLKSRKTHKKCDLRNRVALLYDYRSNISRQLHLQFLQVLMHFYKAELLFSAATAFHIPLILGDEPLDLTQL
jgi:hypothetical protein